MQIGQRHQQQGGEQCECAFHGGRVEVVLLAVIRAGEALQHGLLPLVELCLQVFGGGRLLLNEIGFFGMIGLKVEKFSFGITSLLLVNHEFEVGVDNGPGTEVVGIADGRVAEVGEVAGGNAAHEFDEWRGTPLQFGVDPGFWF